MTSKNLALLAVLFGFSTFAATGCRDDVDDAGGGGRGNSTNDGGNGASNNGGNTSDDGGSSTSNGMCTSTGTEDSEASCTDGVDNDCDTFMVMYDRAAQGTLNTTTLSGIYSYQQAISRKFSIKAGLQATYLQKALDWSKLTFGDMIDPRKGFIYETAGVPRGGTVKAVDFSAGVLGFSDKVYGGFAVHHLNEPNESLIVGTSRLPMKYTAHFGALIPIEKKNKDGDAKLSPNILYRRQGEFQQLNLGVYVNKGPLVAGVWYRGLLFGEKYRDSFIGTIGIQTDVIRFGYSYDITISELTPSTGGSHEVSFGIYFDCRQKKKKFRTIACPSF